MAALSFVNELELEEDKVPPGIIKNQGYVDGGSVASFTSSLSTVHRADVLNSTLLAQLAATRLHHRTKEPDKWYKRYLHVLGKIGWVVQDFQFQKYEVHSQTMQVSKAIIDIIQAILTPNQIQAVEDVLESLRSPPNEPFWKLFDTKSTGPSKDGNFQLMPCFEDKSGQVVMSLGSFFFTASAREDKWLWFEYNSTDVHLFKATQIATLDESVYCTIREAVINKLGDNASTFIGELKI